MDLNQVTIGSTDVARSTRFYQQLGLRLVVDSAPRYVRFECPNGAATFSIHHVDTVAAPATTLIYFDCPDLDQRYRQLCTAGVIFDSAPEDQRWLWREARLRDPDGNRRIVARNRAGTRRRFFARGTTEPGLDLRQLVVD